MLGTILITAPVLLLGTTMLLRADRGAEPGGLAGAILAVILLLTASVDF